MPKVGICAAVVLRPGDQIWPPLVNKLNHYVIHSYMHFTYYLTIVLGHLREWGFRSVYNMSYI